LANVAWQSNSVFSSFSSTNLDSFDNQFTSILLPYVGLQFQKKIGKGFELNLESQISLKGEQVANGGYSIKFMYLKLIPSLEFEIAKGIKCGAGIFGGVKLKEYLPEFRQFIQSINLYDYGGMASLSYSFKKITFRFAYQQSINVAYSLYLRSKKKNRVFQLGVGYRLVGAESKESKRR